MCIDHEEPLKQSQYHTAKFKGNDQTTYDKNSNSTHDDSITPIEEVKMSDEQDCKVLSFEEEQDSSISVGVQCSIAKKLHDVVTQTDYNSLLRHCSTQSDAVQLVDAASQANVTNNSIMTQLTDDKHLNDRQLTDDLAMAQSTIVWQSLMIKILKINTNTVS